MASSLHDQAAAVSTLEPPLAVDLAAVRTLCPADEQKHWQTLSMLLEQACAAQADEIHLEPDDECLRLRLRGAFRFEETRLDEPVRYIECLGLLQRYLWKELLPSTARRGWFSYTLGTGPRLMQLDAVPTSRGDTFLITLLHDLKQPPARIDELALGKSQQQTLRTLLKQESGLILLASDQAQARARTARAIAQEMVSPDRKIAFADAPGHPFLPRVTQLVMDTLAAPTQASLWPAVCELGCDAIVAWRTSDEQMAQQLVRQASESTLVVQGVAVRTAADAVDQLLGMGIRSVALARSLKAILVQRRLQCLCPYCRSTQSPDDHGTAWLAEYSPIKGGNINDWLRHRMRASFSAAPGCEQCQFTGTANALDLFAIVDIGDDIRDALYDGQIRLALNKLRDRQDFSRDLMRLSQDGIISLAEAERIQPANRQIS